MEEKNIRNRLTAMLTASVFLLAAAFFLLQNLSAATPSDKAQPIERPRVVATTAHIADIVDNLAGESIRLDTLIKTGIDPHLYRPVRSDIVRLAQADLIFYNGRNLEGRMSGLLEEIAKEKPAIAIADHISTILYEEQGTYDPHVWMDVKNWIEATETIRAALEELLPDQRESIARNAASYIGLLTNLDQDIRAGIQRIPEEHRILITAHDAFAYYGAAYNIRVIGVQGISTASEAGLNKIENLVQTIVEAGIPAIFAETSVSDQNIRAIREGVAHQGQNLSLGEPLYSDSLGEAGTPTSTYVGMMRHNTNAIVSALGGSPLPEPIQTPTN